jgi:uncharacterized protein YggE
MVKRIGFLVVGIALVASIALAGVWLWGQATGPVAAQSGDAMADYNPAQTVTVVGRGSVRLAPDVARVSIGVETMAETVAEAVDENQAKMTSILEALKAVGIPEADIQTMHYSIQFERYPEPMPRTGTESGEQPQPQYRVSNMVEVTVRDLSQVGEVLDAVVEAGANNIWGVNFSLEDPESAEADARAEAVADARARAEALAELNGVELGSVMSVSEVISGSGVPVPMGAAERAVAGAGPIAPGEVEVSYQIQVTYFIEP